MHIITFWNISCGAFVVKPIILGLVDKSSFENEVFADIPLYDLKLGTQTTFTALAHTYLNPQGWVPHWLPQGSQPEPKNYLKYYRNMTIFLSLFAKWLISLWPPQYEHPNHFFCISQPHSQPLVVSHTPVTPGVPTRNQKPSKIPWIYDLFLSLFCHVINIRSYITKMGTHSTFSASAHCIPNP